MKQSTSKLQIFIIVLALVSTAASPIFATTAKKDFDVSAAYGDRDTFDITAAEGGCIIARIDSWTNSKSGEKPTTKLALILNGSDRTEYYARSDGNATNKTPLWVSYSVSSTQVSKVKKWSVAVVNFTKSGTAKGTLYLEYPPSQTPCQLEVAVSKIKGQVDLRWLYTGKPFKGSFLVERSTDGTKWSAVSVCKKSAPMSATSSSSYTCSDTRLNSGTIYYYRACAITTGSACDIKQNITPAKYVNVP
jgi:hypothetical protein